MTDERLFDSISRLRAWIRDYGDLQQPVFIEDLMAVLDALEETRRNAELISAKVKAIKSDGRLSQIIANVEAIRRDAARWRWLVRDSKTRLAAIDILQGATAFGSIVEAVDEAMTQE